MATIRKFTTHTTGAEHEPPVAVLATTQINAVIGAVIQLDGRKSTVGSGRRLTFHWKFNQVPIGSSIDETKLKDIRPGSTAVSFIPDKTGLYVLQLTVNDGELDSEPVSASIDIQISRVPIGENIIPDAYFLWSFLSDFWQLVEDREKITSVWSSTIQMLGAEFIKLWSNDYNKSIATIQPSVQRRWLDYHSVLDLSAQQQQQRIIVGKTSDGDSGKTGNLGQVPGVGTTSLFYVPFGSTPPSEADFTKLKGNYGAKGRIISINGVGYTISRVATITDPTTSDKFSQVVVNESSIPDGLVGVVWRVPHLLHTPGFDLEANGVRRGDVLVLEFTRGDTGLSSTLRTQVVAVDRERVGFELSLSELGVGSNAIDRTLMRELVVALRLVPSQATDDEIAGMAEALIAYIPAGVNLSTRPFSQFRITVKAKSVVRNSVIPASAETISVPVLQEQLKDPPVVLRENADYVVEDGEIRFISGLFTPESPAPEKLWAEVTFIDNSPVVENNFGLLVNLSKDDLTKKQTRAPYLSAVRGLMYAYTTGPKAASMRLGLQILLGLPFTEERCVILSIEPEFANDSSGNVLGRILVEFLDSNNAKTGVRQVYFYPSSVGLEANPLTNQEFKVGDVVEQFIPLSKGVEVVDYLLDPTWWQRSLAGLEILKYFTFKISIDSVAFDHNDLSFALDFLKRIKASYTKVLVEAILSLSDDIAVDDLLAPGPDSLHASGMVMRFYDNTWGLEACNKTSDDNHQGVVLWHPGSPPFQTRTLHLLRDVRTYKDGTAVMVSSVTGWAPTMLRGHMVGTPVIEGDLLVILPGQPGAGPVAPGLYEISDVLSANLLQILQVAPFTAPTTFAVTPIDEDLFEYGENLICAIVRRGSNPIVMGSDLVTTVLDSVVTSASSRFKTDAVSPGDYLIIEPGPGPGTNPNMGEYFIDAVIPFDPGPPLVPPNITETQLLLRMEDGTAPVFVADVDQEFRVVRRASQAKVVYEARTYLDGLRVMLEVLDPVGNPRDIFTPGMVGLTIVISNSEKPANDGPQFITEYINCGRVALDFSLSTDTDTIAQAVIHF